jgi:hypothetical protein
MNATEVIDEDDDMLHDNDVSQVTTVIKLSLPGTKGAASFGQLAVLSTESKWFRLSEMER